MEIDVIPGGIDVVEGHPDHLAHATATAEQLRKRWGNGPAKALLADWERLAFERSYLNNNFGRFGGKIDLRGVNLSRRILSGKDLSGIDFYSSNFKLAQIVQSNLDGSLLSETDIRGANLSWSSAEGTFFDNVRFNRNTKLLGINLGEPNFNFAYFLEEQAQSERRIAHMQKRSPILAFLLKVSCDYGRSLGRLGLFSTVIIAIYSAFFYQIRDQFTGLEHPIDDVYFTVVTFTTVGYGDILPITPLARLLSLLDAVTGYLMGGLLISILANRVIGK